MRQLRLLGVKRQRNEALKTAGLVLLLSQANHVIDAVFDRFDMAVKHRRVRFQAGSVDFSGKVQNAFRSAYMHTDDPTGLPKKSATRSTRARLATSRQQLINHVFGLHPTR